MGLCGEAINTELMCFCSSFFDSNKKSEFLIGESDISQKSYQIVRLTVTKMVAKRIRKKGL